jgi:hypothetical protein
MMLPVRWIGREMGASLSNDRFRRKVCHPWDGGPHRLTIYFARWTERPRSRA